MDQFAYKYNYSKTSIFCYVALESTEDDFITEGTAVLCYYF